MVADGKVYVGNQRGEFFILAADRELKILDQIPLDASICATAVAANGVLYVTTLERLYAVAQAGE